MRTWLLYSRPKALYNKLYARDQAKSQEIRYLKQIKMCKYQDYTASMMSAVTKTAI